MGPQMPDILKFYGGYKDMSGSPKLSKEEPDTMEDSIEGIAAPEAHISAVVKGKLITKSSIACQTMYEPGLGSLVDYLKSEQDARALMEISSTSLPEPETVKKKATLTNGYNDYREEEPPETLVNLMSEIREDLNLLRGVEKYTTYRTKSVESLLTLLSDTSYLSVESYLYDSDYREGRSEEARKFKVERKKSRLGRVLQTKKHTSFNVECWEETCGLISSDEEIPMDEFTLAKKIIADLNPEDALEYAIRYLQDRGDPIAVLPGVHRIPRLEVWYNNRRTLKTKKEKEQEKLELFDKSYHIWNTPYYKVTGMATPEISTPRCVTWDWVEKVKGEADELRSKHFSIVKQQLVTNARNYFPSMFTDHYNNKLMKDFRRTFFAYMPSKEMDVITYNAGKKTQDELDAIASCYKNDAKVVKTPSEAPKIKKKKSRLRSVEIPQKKTVALSFAIADSPEK